MQRVIKRRMAREVGTSPAYVILPKGKYNIRKTKALHEFAIAVTAPSPCNTSLFQSLPGGK